MKLQCPGKRTLFLIPGLLLLLGTSGCVATQGWVQKQLDPLRGQVSEVESRVGQSELRSDLMADRVSQVEAGLDQNQAQAELALKNLEHLRLEQHFVLGIKEGANFALNSAGLTAEAEQAIDEFLRTLNGTKDAIFLVAGHTDSTGPADYNYALGQKRAASVAQYLITHRGIDPLRVTVVSYGENAPLADNFTSQGRYQNRRVEILAYTESITSAPGSQRLELQRTNP